MRTMLFISSFNAHVFDTHLIYWEQHSWLIGFHEILFWSVLCHIFTFFFSRIISRTTPRWFFLITSCCVQWWCSDIYIWLMRNKLMVRSHGITPYIFFCPWRSLRVQVQWTIHKVCHCFSNVFRIHRRIQWMHTQRTHPYMCYGIHRIYPLDRWSVINNCSSMAYRSVSVI